MGLLFDFDQKLYACNIVLEKIVIFKVEFFADVYIDYLKEFEIILDKNKSN